MADIVTFYNSKGGQGKTTLATHYALFVGAHYYTNDYKSGTEDLFKEVITPERFHVISPDAVDIETVDNMVFDCGGFIDGKIPAILKASDLCIIPIFYQSQADLRAFFIIRDAIAKLNQRILIVINNTPSKQATELLEGLKDALGGEYPIMCVKHSAYMGYLANEGKTPFGLKEIGVAGVALTVVREQLTNLFNFIKDLNSLKVF